MTDRHNLIFHLMLAAMIASIVSLIIDKHSFYDHLKVDYIRQLHHQGQTDLSPDAGDHILEKENHPAKV